MRTFLLCLALLCASRATAQPASDCEDPASTRRIQTWLSHVERFLRQQDVSHLSPLQRERRAVHLGHLQAYWRAGRFPHNHVTPGLAPVFIDEHGTACAVGQLLLQGGAAELAHQIAREQLLGRLPEIDSPALARWARENGFTLEELALIQPSYAAHRSSREVCLSQPPIAYRDAGGWTSARTPLGVLVEHSRPGAYPWLMPGEDGELWLLERGGGILSWSGHAFRTAEVAPPEESSPRLRVLPNALIETGVPGGSLLIPDSEARFGVARLSEGGFVPEMLALTGLHPELYALWQDQGKGVVFGVGRDGTLVRRTPYESWVALASPTEAPLLAIDGTGPTDLWAVGGAGTALHFDGEQWQRVETGTDEGLIAVAAGAPGEAWAVGTGGTVLRFDGQRFRPVSVGVSSTLRAIAVREGEVWVGGDEGVILHQRDGTWERESLPDPLPVTSLGFSGDTVFAATDAEVRCRLAFGAYDEDSSGVTSPHEPAPWTVAVLLPAGLLQAAVTGISTAEVRQPPLLVFVVILNAALLGVLVLRGRGTRGAAWTNAAVLGVWCLVQGAAMLAPRSVDGFYLSGDEAPRQGGALGRIQDWLLLEHDLTHTPEGTETHRLAAASWETPEDFILHAKRGPGNERDRELRARYARLMSGSPVSPFEFLRKYREKQKKMKDYFRNNEY
jgi:hypothetical protein